jgi:NAD(P)-dependent dehydrogenase (short-subunit alcohol dehydrogenase family)
LNNNDLYTKKEEVKKMTERLKGKVAVVTGGGDGIGRGVALALAAEGAKVVVNDIDRDSAGTFVADKVVEEIKKAKGTAAANYDSVATMKGGENIIKTATGNFGRIDILVNCAGNFMKVMSWEITEEQFDSIMSVHVKGHFACIKAAIPEMMKQKSGRIINISSRAAAGGAGNIAYNAAKAGIVGLTSGLSPELMEYGITVNAILPSAETKLFSGPRPKAMMGGLPVPLFMDPEYVAPMIVFLATDEAQNITGKFIYACGGDLCVYSKPFEVPGKPHTIIRKLGKWTLDELSQVIPPIVE